MEIYDPVCGSNGITYPNECNLEIAKCSYPYLSDIYVIHPGVCGVGTTTTTTKSKIFDNLFYNLFLYSRVQYDLRKSRSYCFVYLLAYCLY